MRCSTGAIRRGSAATDSSVSISIPPATPGRGRCAGPPARRSCAGPGRDERADRLGHAEGVPQGDARWLGQHGHHRASTDRTASTPPTGTSSRPSSRCAATKWASRSASSRRSPRDGSRPHPAEQRDLSAGPPDPLGGGGQRRRPLSAPRRPTRGPRRPGRRPGPSRRSRHRSPPAPAGPAATTDRPAVRPPGSGRRRGRSVGWRCRRPPPPRPGRRSARTRGNDSHSRVSTSAYSVQRAAGSPGPGRAATASLTSSPAPARSTIPTWPSVARSIDSTRRAVL